MSTWLLITTPAVLNLCCCIDLPLCTLHHGRVLLLEPLVQPGGALQVLVDAAHDTLLFTIDEGLGGEVIDTVIKTALDHFGVHLEQRARSVKHNGGILYGTGNSRKRLQAGHL